MKALKLLAIVLALGCCATSARATTRTVTSTNDDGGTFTLRTLISASLSNDVINFAVTGTITLTNELDIGRNLTITGPGAKLLAISGSNAFRVFNIASGTVNISGLTITKGLASSLGDGGGIYNHGTLALTACTLSGNSALVEGGGICNDWGGGTLTLSNCTLSGNSTSGGGGGGIYNAGDSAVTLVNCTLSANSIEGPHGYGGAIYNGFYGTLTLTACTLSGNSASSGGGLYSDRSATVGNTIIAGNTGSIPDVSCTNIITSGYNLIGDATESSGWGANDLTGGAGGLALNPLLGPLQDNGGPTPTMAPQASSAAIDNGYSFCLTTDQRGLPRPVVLPGYVPVTSGGDHSDIGAVEVQSVQADIGLRAYDGTSIVKLSGEVGNISSPLRISKNGTTYGILLVATNDASASKIRIPTSSGVKAMMKLP